MKESMSKVPKEIGEPRKPISQIHNVEHLSEKAKQYNVGIAQKAIEQAYIFDNRFVWIDLEDYNSQREVIDLLYKMDDYNSMSFDNVLISSIDKDNNRRLVFLGNTDIINELNESIQDIKFRWTGEQFEAVILRGNEEFAQNIRQIRFLLEEKILGYHRIVRKEDIITSKEMLEYGKNIRVHEIANPKTFYTAISSSQNSNSHSAFVHIYEPEEYADKSLFLVNAGCAGCAGCAVSKDGDIVSVFKNSEMAQKDDIEKISTVLLLTAIENGGIKLDCFDGFLPRNYMKYGFIPVCKVPFNDELAPSGWNYQRDGRPERIFFRHNGKSVEEILKEIKEGTYTIYDVDTLPVIQDNDEATQYRDEIIRQQQEVTNELSKENKEGQDYGE